MSSSSRSSLVLIIGIIALFAIALTARPASATGSSSSSTGINNNSTNNSTVRPATFPTPGANRGSTRNFAVLAHAGVTRTDPVTCYGDVGSYATPLEAVTFTHSAGADHPDADLACKVGQDDITIFYGDILSRACDYNMDTIDLGGLTLYPAVYCWGASATLSAGTLVLDGLGDPNAQFFFQIAASLTIAQSTTVAVQNSQSACNVYWAVGATATIMELTSVAGSIASYAAINFHYSTVLYGSALSSTASITFDGAATIGTAACNTATNVATQSSSSSGVSSSSSSSTGSSSSSISSSSSKLPSSSSSGTSTLSSSSATTLASSSSASTQALPSSSSSSSSSATTLAASSSGTSTGSSIKTSTGSISASSSPDTNLPTSSTAHADLIFSSASVIRSIVSVVVPLTTAAAAVILLAQF